MKDIRAADQPRPRFALGERARDTVTGTEGLITGRTEYLFSVTTYLLTPERTNADGLPAAGAWYNESQLVRIERREDAAALPTDARYDSRIPELHLPVGSRIDPMLGVNGGAWSADGQPLPEPRWPFALPPIDRTGRVIPHGPWTRQQWGHE